MSPVQKLRDFYNRVEVEEGYNKVIEETPQGFTVTFSKQGREDEFSRSDIIRGDLEKNEEGEETEVVYFSITERFSVDLGGDKRVNTLEGKAERYTRIDDLDTGAYWVVVKNRIENHLSDIVITLQDEFSFAGHNFLQQLQMKIVGPIGELLSVYPFPFKKLVIFTNHKRTDVLILKDDGVIEHTIEPELGLDYPSTVVDYLSEQFEKVIGEIDYKKIYAEVTCQADFEEIVEGEIRLKSYGELGEGFVRTLENRDGNLCAVFKEKTRGVEETISAIDLAPKSDNLFTKLSKIRMALLNVNTSLSVAYRKLGLKLTKVHKLIKIMEEVGIKDQYEVREIDDEHYIVLKNNLFVSLNYLSGSSSYTANVYWIKYDAKQRVTSTTISTGETASQEVKAFFDKLEAWLDYDKINSFTFLSETYLYQNGLLFEPKDSKGNVLAFCLDLCGFYGGITVEHHLGDFSLGIREEVDINRPLHTFVEQYDNPDRFYEKQREIAKIARGQWVEVEGLYDPANLSDNEA